MWTELQRKYLKNYLKCLKPTWGGRFLSIFLGIPFRKKISLENMRHVFGSVFTEDEIKKLLLCFYSHLTTSFKESFFINFISLKKMKRQVEVKGKDYLIEITKQGSGVIVITGHLGNWEFAPIAAILNFQEFKGRFYFVRKALVYTSIEKILFRRYHQVGLNIIPKTNSLERICEELEANHVVVFAIDQHASLCCKDGISVDFFGKKAGTFKSMAMIARHLKVPVVPARTYRRQSDQKHVVEFFPPLSWQKSENPQEEIILNTRKYNEQIEHFIFEHPEQWNWMHKRWKEE